MENVGAHCLNRGLTRMTRINADFKPLSMHTLPLQWSDMSIEYMKSTVFRSSGAVCLQDAFQLLSFLLLSSPLCTTEMRKSTVSKACFRISANASRCPRLSTPK